MKAEIPVATNGSKERLLNLGWVYLGKYNDCEMFSCPSGAMTLVQNGEDTTICLDNEIMCDASVTAHRVAAFLSVLLGYKAKQDFT